MTAKIKTDNNRPTPEEAREVLAQNQQEKLQACRNEVDAVLKKHNCRLDVAVLITAQRNIPQVQIVPND